jgi:hypothetical protein
VPFKPAKIKPARGIPQAMRGARGRFVGKAEVQGKAKMKRFFAVVRESAMTIARRELRGIAEAAVEELRERIAAQDVPGMGGRAFGKPRVFSNPLHPFTLKEKQRKGQDSRRLIATGAYVNSISVVEQKKGKGWTYKVGFDRERHPGGLPMETLGRILEYGAKIKVTPKMRAYLRWRGLFLRKTTTHIVIPARPHWMPIFLRVKRYARRLAEDASENLAAALKNELRQARVMV